jgi:lipoprotein-anchoring transpeptidase ErfK/SrfK
MISRLGWSLLRGGLTGIFLAAFGSVAQAEMAAEMRIASLDVAALRSATSESPGQQVTARVDVSEQKMRVYIGADLVHEFDVSTGRKGYGTPTGRYQVQWTHPKWYSRKYDMAPMPWAVFFHGGFAVHGTTAVKRLGRPASHGCVRLAPKNAKIFSARSRQRLREHGGQHRPLRPDVPAWPPWPDSRSPRSV